MSGPHHRGDRPPAIAPQIERQHPRMETPDQRAQRIEMFVEAIEKPNTGNGYNENPLAILKVQQPPEHLSTISDYAESLKARSENIVRWTKDNSQWADYSKVVLNMLARMEGDIQSLRIMLKSTPGKNQEIDTILSHLGK